MSKTIKYKEKLFEVYDSSDLPLKNQFKDICIDDTTMCHLYKFMCALKKVKKSYYTRDLNEKIIQKISRRKYGISIKDVMYKQTERVFAYELYHQWSCMLCPSKEYVLNAESRKQIEWFGNHVMKKLPQSTNGKQSFPDLILHKEDSDDGQLIICEIKRKDRLISDIVTDIESLTLFTKKGKKKDCDIEPFNCGIFLVFCDSFKHIIRVIRSKMNELIKAIGDKSGKCNIICVSCDYNPHSEDLEIYFQTVSEIIRQLKENKMV
mgnify:CR=1 FL=1